MIWCLMNDDEDVHNDVHACSLQHGMKGRAEQLMAVQCVLVPQDQADEVLVCTDVYAVNANNTVSLGYIFGESPCLLALVNTRVLINLSLTFHSFPTKYKLQFRPQYFVDEGNDKHALNGIVKGT